MKNIQVEYVLVACCFKLIVFGKGKDYLDYSVFITKNVMVDLFVMRIEAFVELTARFELYGALKQGLDDIEAGRVVSAEDAKEMFRKKYPGANI